MDKTQGLFRSRGHIILASNSPRRRELLLSVGIGFDVIPADVDESYLLGERFDEHVTRLSEEKARAIADRFPGAFVLGSDTIVVIDDTLLGKPGDESEAQAMLSRLSGRTHTVFTGFCLIAKTTGIKRAGFVSSKVTMKELTSDEIEAYVATGEPMDKAGAYAIQGYSAYMVARVEGSYTTIVGLPLTEVIGLLKEVGAIEFRPAEGDRR